LAPSVCLVFYIVSCRYCVPSGATLKSMAKHYFLNVDWLRLYNSNPNVTNPDFVLTQQAIQVGPIYSVTQFCVYVCVMCVEVDMCAQSAYVSFSLACPCLRSWCVCTSLVCVPRFEAEFRYLSLSLSLSLFRWPQGTRSSP
jgi:hypothetical protein